MDFSRRVVPACLIAFIAACGDEEATRDESDTSAADTRDAGGDVTDAGDVSTGDAADTETDVPSDVGDDSTRDTADDSGGDATGDAMGDGPADAAGDTPSDTADAPDGEDPDADAGDADTDVVEPECTPSNPCVDDNACDGVTACIDGACLAGDAPGDGSACPLGAADTLGGICLDETCGPSECGDSWVDFAAGEQCDDGGHEVGDGCNPDCQRECSAAIADPCNDDLDCTTDRCNVATGLCEFVAADEDGDRVDCLADCDDDDELNYPGNTEVCDGRDNDCDTRLDDGLSFETWYQDLPDRDGYGDSDTGVLTCMMPGEDWSLFDGDCATSDPTRHPGAPELCNSLDDDCDDVADENFPTLGSTCDSAVDTDLCATGVVVCAADGLGTTCSDDAASTVEVCDLSDNDCDGQIDEGVGVSTWYADCDADGYAATTAVATSSCGVTAPAVATGCAGGGGQWVNRVPTGLEASDFNDANAAINPTDSPRLATIHPTVFVGCTGCHGTSGGLDLTNNATLRTRLLANSSALPTMPRITPGDPSRSYLWHKVNGTQRSVGGTGGQMGSLNSTQLSTLRTWIEHGALP